MLWLVLASGCKQPAGLKVNLLLSDALFGNTSTARIVIARDDGSSFPPTDAPRSISTGLTVRNYDASGDGATDIVLEFAEAYPFDKTNHFEVVPGTLPQSVNVDVSVEVYDSLANLLARLPADDQGREFVSAVLTPGKTTSAPDLVPACVATCTSATVSSHPATTLNPLDAAISAMAGGNMLGAPGRHSDLAVAAAFAARPDGAPTAGHVRIYFGSTTLSADGDVNIVGASGGDQLGTAIAIGDLDGDGKADLVMGAPGASHSAGEVWVLYGMTPLKQNASIDLAAPASAVVWGKFTAPNPGDLVGTALALSTDGNGKPLVLAGAPGANMGAGAIYALGAGDFTNMPTTADGGVAPKGVAIAGRPSSQLGRAMASLGGQVAAGAPLDADGNGKAVGAVYLFSAATDFAGLYQATDLGRWLGDGGGFGSTVGLANLDGSGTATLISGAPAAGAGNVTLRPATHLDGDVTGAMQAVRGTSPMGLLGAAIAHVPRANGDLLVLGAPTALTGAMPGTMIGAGAVLVVRPGTLQVIPSLKIGADGQPAAAIAVGADDADAFGAQLTVGDFNSDGYPDVAVGAAGSRKVYLVVDPAR
jgi:hypothetical protein